MLNCYLCGEKAVINARDNRKIVRCESCGGYYEIEQLAIRYIQDKEFGNKRLNELRSTVIEINQRKLDAEIVVSGDILSARVKNLDK